jgi:hypothetical protein
MAGPSRSPLTADHPNLLEAVGQMRWEEWGHAPEPESLGWWISATRGEAGRTSLPMTFVAVDPAAQPSQRSGRRSSTSKNVAPVRLG